MGGFQSLLYLSIIYSVVSGRCPDSSRGQTKKYGGTCLEFIKDEVRQPEAVSYCTRQGGHLVTVENREKQAWLETMLKEELMWVDSGSGVNAWLGVVRDDESYPNWYLEDGGYHSTGEKKELKYTNWDDNEPEPIKNRKCAVFGFSSEFKWQASICNQFPYEYHIICQYDGPDGFLGKPEAYITIIVLSLILLMAGVIVFPWYCYRRRKALKTQLRKSREEDLYEDHIINTDRNTSAEYTREDNPQAHYAPVTNIPTNNNSYHNFNILSDPLYRHDKPLHKDLSLQSDALLIPSDSTPLHIEYGRSVSSPPNLVKPSAPPCEDLMASVDEEASNVDDMQLLHKQRPSSCVSNNLSV